MNLIVVELRNVVYSYSREHDHLRGKNVFCSTSVATRWFICISERQELKE